MKNCCKWKYDEFYDKWNTQCNNSFCLINGTPETNEMIYCPYCGNLIKQIKGDK